MTVFPKFGWLVGASLILAPVAEVRGADAPHAAGRTTNFHHTKWTSKNGVGAVFDIKQSSNGYLWLTTSKGVLRFDGVRFQSIEEVTDGAVGNDEIDSVFLASSGGLWLTTQSAGLLFWKDGRLTEFPDRRCTPTRKRGKLVESRDGSLWVQGASGLFHLRGSVCEQIGIEQGYTGGFPAGILMDKDGTLWVKTRLGPLLFLRHGQSTFQRSEFGEGPSTSYAFLHEGPDGGIWLSDDQGLRQVVNKPAASPMLGRSGKGNSPFGDFTFAPDGSLWTLTANGVQRFYGVPQWAAPRTVETAPSEVFTPRQGLSSDAVWAVLIDREGSVWVGTNSGLDRLRRAALSKLLLPPAPEYEYSVAAGDAGSVWTGNSSLPLTHVTADGAITSFPRTGQTLTLRRDHNGTIWSAGRGDFHLWRSSPTGFAPLHYPEESLDAVVAVATDRHNNPWIATRSGRAYHLSGGKWSNQNKALGKKPGVIGTMVDDQEGNIWFAFSNKVVQWDGFTYHTFSWPPGTRNVSQNTMAVRGDHVWVAGAGGVQLFTRGSFYLMRWKDPNLPGRVSGIVETATGDLWVNGFSGITHVSAAELKKWLHDPGYTVSAEHFDELDGLPGLSGERLPEPSVVEAPDGRLWFATTQGIARLDPAALESNRNRLPPPVIVSGIISNGKTHADSNGLRLPARTENLEIVYTALSLAIPERVLFRYKLEGVDEDWRDAGTRREAFYSNLGPGQYRFRVMACNNDGVWNEAGATLEFSILPAWYQTWWFLSLCVASVFAGFYLLYLLRMRQVTQRVRGRLQERLDERERIARELHDTLLQSVQGLILKFDAVAKQIPGEEPARQAIEKTLDHADQVVAEGRDRVRSLRGDAASLRDLPEAFQRVAEEASGGREATFKTVVEGSTRDLHPVVLEECYSIGREALFNALTHSGGLHIEAEIAYDARQFRLRIRDNGCGIDPAILEKGGRENHWGLRGMRERARKIGAHLQLWSRPGAGTEVELVVPAATAYRSARPRTWMSVFRRSGIGPEQR